MMMLTRITALSATALLACTPAMAATPQASLQLKNRAFQPAELQVPAGTKVKLTVHNADSIPAEFESYDLSREVVVPGGSDVVVYIGPLDAGRYKFFNDFNPAATGYVIAADAIKP